MNGESQNNIQNRINNEEISNPINPLDNSSFAERQQENESNLDSKDNINLYNIEGNENESFRIIIANIEDILEKSSITLDININNENSIEYKDIIYNEKSLISYENFKNYF
jgi:hypothetical protein